jgi:hypothetical protein
MNYFFGLQMYTNLYLQQILFSNYLKIFKVLLLLLFLPNVIFAELKLYYD